MSSDHLERIFHHIPTIAHQEEYEGTGIGLAIATKNSSSTRWKYLG